MTTCSDYDLQLKKTLEEFNSYLISGYEIVHKFPMIEHKIAYGTKGFPWNINKKNSKKGKIICKNAERLHERSFIGIEVCLYELSNKDIDLIIKSFYKIWKKLKL